MSVEKLVEHFSLLEDPRCAGKVKHRLLDILVIAVCAVIARAESMGRHALYGRNPMRQALGRAHFCGFVVPGAGMNLGPVVDFSDNGSSARRNRDGQGQQARPGGAGGGSSSMPLDRSIAVIR